MKHFSPKQFLIISTVFLLFSSMVFAFLYAEINQKQVALQSSKALWESEATERANIESLSVLLDSVEEEKIKLESHFVSSLDVVPFLDTLESLARRVGVKPEVSAVEVSKDKESLLVDIKATGDFEDIYRFVTLLENSPYELEFMHADIRDTTPQINSEAENSGWTATFSLKLISFINIEQ